MQVNRQRKFKLSKSRHQNKRGSHSIRAACAGRKTGRRTETSFFSSPKPAKKTGLFQGSGDKERLDQPTAHEVWGDGTVKPEFLAQKVKFGVAKGYEALVRNAEMTFEQMLAELRFYQGHKVGSGLVSGPVSIESLVRSDANMVANYFMIFDFDIGKPIEEIVQCIAGEGLLAFFYTTSTHGKTVSVVGEKALDSFISGQDMSDEEACLAYLLDKKKYHPPLLKDATYCGRRSIIEKGRAVVAHAVLHQPQPRYRAILPLSEPFEFLLPGTSSEERRQLWKRYYRAFCVKLELPYDKACETPSHFQFTPRVDADAKFGGEGHRRILVPGELLDLSTIELPKDEPKKTSSRRGKQSGSTSKPNDADFKTKNLLRFAALAAADFEMADFMADNYGEANIRREKSDGEFDFRCPREDFHSEPGDDDTAFHVKNASANDGHGFAAWCMHAGCKDEWERNGKVDRLAVLDTVCQDLEINDAFDLITQEWTPGVERPQTAGSTPIEPDEIRAKIDALDKDTNPEDLEQVYRMIAVLGRPTFDKQFADAIKEKTGIGKKEFEKCISAERRKVKAIRQEVAEGEDEGPPDESKWSSLNEIELRWGHNDVVRMTTAIAIELNRNDPTVFVTNNGQTCRLMRPEDGDDPTLKPMQSGHWRQLLLAAQYISINEKGDELVVGVPDNVVSHLNGGALFEQLPRLKGITRVPVFNADGEIITREGYDPKLKVYFSPNMDFKTVPTDGSAEQHVPWAVNILLGEAYRDFPFSDKFRTDVDDLPIYREERDDEGYRLPNFERGVSSRAHVLAMTLQPFVRAMIMGPTPMYFMDKSQPGSGAGYLANVPSITLEGKPATPQRMSSNDEEFAKAISA